MSCTAAGLSGRIAWPDPLDGWSLHEPDPSQAARGTQDGRRVNNQEFLEHSEGEGYEEGTEVEASSEESDPKGVKGDKTSRCSR